MKEVDNGEIEMNKADSDGKDNEADSGVKESAKMSARDDDENKLEKLCDAQRDKGDATIIELDDTKHKI